MTGAGVIPFNPKIDRRSVASTQWQQPSICWLETYEIVRIRHRKFGSDYLSHSICLNAHN